MALRRSIRKRKFIYSLKEIRLRKSSRTSKRLGKSPSLKARDVLFIDNKSVRYINQVTVSRAEGIAVSLELVVRLNFCNWVR